MIRIFVIFLFSLLSGVANAAFTTSTGTISLILNYEGHDGPLITLSNMASTSGYCPRNDLYILPLTHKFMSQNYALLLSAKMTGKSVTAEFESGDCVQGLPRIRHLHLRD